MMMSLLTVLALSAGGISAAPNSVEHQRQLLAAAKHAYDEAAGIGARDPDAARRNYEDAARNFESLIDSGVENGKLYYNLGNTYVRLGRIGKAIACYRRAEKLSPGDANLAENLRYARSLQQDRIAQPATADALRYLLFWHYATPLNLRAWIGATAYIALWILLAVGLYFRPRPAALKWATAACAVLAVSLAASVGFDLYNANHSRAGVLTADNVLLRKGNGDSYEPRFDYRFSDGVEFTLDEPPRGDWLHVRLADGKDGWIRRDQADLL